jgi:hypothetical protein
MEEVLMLTERRLRLARRRRLLIEGGGVSDPAFSNVVALLGFEAEADEATTVTDEATHASTWTASSNVLAKVEDDTAKFGSNSFEVGGGSLDRLTVDNHARYDMATSDFTIEMFVNFTTLPGGSGGRGLASDWGLTSNAAWWWYWDDAGNMEFKYTEDGTEAAATTVSAAWSPSAGTWYHVAVCREGSNLRMFVDGVQVGTTHNIGTADIYTSTRQKHIGYSNGTASHYGNQHMDEFRWVIGEALYTESFTAPTAAHARS